MVKYAADKTMRIQRRLAVGQKCPYCRRVMLSPGVDEYSELDPTVDHVITRGRNGSNDSENLIWCCRRCNNLRGEVHYEVFARFAQAVLVSYPDAPKAFLRNSLREFVNWLAFYGLSKRASVNQAVRMSLLHLAADMGKI